MTSFYICYPHLPVSATITPPAAATGYSIDNTISGERTKHYRASSASTSINIDYDLGTSVTANPDYFLMARADFLRRADSSDPVLTLKGDSSAGFGTAESQALTLTSSVLYGPSGQDTIKETTYSTAYRYWRLTVATTESVKQEFSKFYFGSFFDLGRDPVYGARMSIDRKQQDMRRESRKFSLQWRGISEANRILFNNTIYKNADIHPVFLYDSDNAVFDGEKIIHAAIERVTWVVGHFANDLTIDFSELI